MPVRKTSKSQSRRKSSSSESGVITKRVAKVCLFCETKKDPEYTDSATLKKFMSDRSRIMPRAKTGVCSRHQRFITRHIKYARHLSLLPFVNQI